MFSVGDTVFYGNNGICCVKDIVWKESAVEHTKRQYYMLQPIHASGCTIYTPVDNENTLMRSLISKEEALGLLEEAGQAQPLQFENERFLENEYKQILRSADCHQWLRLIKTLELRKIEREATGKKITNTDARYLKEVKEYLAAEIAFVLDQDKTQVAETLENIDWSL